MIGGLRLTAAPQARSERRRSSLISGREERAFPAPLIQQQSMRRGAIRHGVEVSDQSRRSCRCVPHQDSFVSRDLVNTPVRGSLYLSRSTSERASERRRRRGPRTARSNSVPPQPHHVQLSRHSLSSLPSPHRTRCSARSSPRCVKDGCGEAGVPPAALRLVLELLVASPLARTAPARTLHAELRSVCGGGVGRRRRGLCVPR